MCTLLEEEGYELANVDEADALRMYRRVGCKPVPVDVDWAEVYDDDPIFRCLRRDLGLSRSQLRTRLNQVRNHLA